MVQLRRYHLRGVCRAAKDDDDMPSSSPQAAAQTELMASASIQTANGTNLQENGRSRASSQSMQKLKSQVDQMASK